MPQKISSPGRLLALLTGSIFMAEFFLMVLLRQCPTLSGLEKAFADSLILIIILSPALYFLYSRPMQREMEARVTAENELKKKNEELGMFAENAAHSLKSSLNPIIGSAWFLRGKYGKRLEGGDAELLSVIEQDGRHMASIIRDLLALSRLEKRAFPEEATEVGDVIHEVLHKLTDGHVAEDSAISARTLT